MDGGITSRLNSRNWPFTFSFICSRFSNPSKTRPPRFVEKILLSSGDAFYYGKSSQSRLHTMLLPGTSCMRTQYRICIGWNCEGVWAWLNYWVSDCVPHTAMPGHIRSCTCWNGINKSKRPSCQTPDHVMTLSFITWSWAIERSRNIPLGSILHTAMDGANAVSFPQRLASLQLAAFLKSNTIYSPESGEGCACVTE